MLDYVDRGITDRLMIKHLEALRKTISVEQQDDFWNAVKQFHDTESFCSAQN